MKTFVVFVILVSLFFTSLGFAETKSKTQTPKYKTEDEAIEHFREQLSKIPLKSFSDILKPFEVSAGDKLNEFDRVANPIYQMAFDKAGKLMRVDVCKAPKLGDTIQRVGYMLVFEHSVAFIDTWLIHTHLGWHLAYMNYFFDSDVIKTLEKIPTVYFTK